MQMQLCSLVVDDDLLHAGQRLDEDVLDVAEELLRALDAVLRHYELAQSASGPLATCNHCPENINYSCITKS